MFEYWFSRSEVLVSVTLLPPRAALTPEVAALIEAVERVRELPPVGDPAVLAALLRASSVVEGLVLREVAAVDAAGSCASVGLPSTAGVVQAATGCSGREASATVRLADRLASDLAPLGALLLSGQVTRRQTEAVLGGLRGLDAAQVAAALPAVCQAATVMDPVLLSTVLREHAEAISPALAAEQRRRLEERAGLTLDEAADGSGHLRGLLTAEQRALLATYLDAKTRAGRVAGDPRSAARRRLDAFLEMVRHTLDCPGITVPSQGGTRAQVTILASAGTVIGLTGATGMTGATGLSGAAPGRLVGSCHGLLSRDELLRMLCDADLNVLHLRARGEPEALDLGRTARTVSPAQWRALVARDHGCVVRGCHRPPAHCQAHHLVHWAKGGPTDLANLALVCHTHHQQVHDQHAVLRTSDGRAFNQDGWTRPPPEPAWRE